MTPLAFAGLVCATLIFVRGLIFERVRAIWPGFLGCALCVGWWVGLAGSLFFTMTPVDHFFAACIVSVAAFASYLGLLRLEGEEPPKCLISRFRAPRASRTRWR